MERETERRKKKKRGDGISTRVCSDSVNVGIYDVLPSSPDECVAFARRTRYNATRVHGYAQPSGWLLSLLFPFPYRVSRTDDSAQESQKD